MDWNPSAPDKLGLQWAVRNREGQQVSKAITSYSSAAVQGMISTDSENIATVESVVTNSGPGFASRVVELLTAGQEVAENFVTTVFRPNASNQAGTKWQSNTGATTNLHSFVDEAVLDTSDYIHNVSKTPAGVSPVLGFEFATAGALAGKRILRWRLHLVGIEITGLGGFGSTGLDIMQDITQGQSLYGRFPIGTPSDVIVDFGEYNNNAARNVNVADIQAIDTAAFRLGLRAFYPWTSDAYNSEFRIYQIYLEVDSCDENRLVRRVGSMTTGQSWTGVIAATPTDSTPWAKDGTDFAVAHRQPRLGNYVYTGSNLATSTMLLQGFGDVPSSTGLVYYPDAILNQDGTVLALGEPIHDTVFAAHFTPSTTDTVDHQDYARVVEVPVSAASGTTNQQELSGASAQQYHGVRLPLIMDESLGDPGTLTVTLKRRSDNFTMGTATITRTEYDAAPVEPVLLQWRMVQAEFAVPATLAAAVQYYLVFTASGVGQWRLQLLTAYVPIPVGSLDPTPVDGTSFGRGTYGGITDVATVEGVDQQYADFSALVYVQPPTPADFTATAGEQEIVFEDDSCD